MENSNEATKEEQRAAISSSIIDTTDTANDHADFAATERYFDQITSGSCSIKTSSSSHHHHHHPAEDQHQNRDQQRNVPCIHPNVAALRQFFTLMPKGGDIHHHFSGSIFAETYLDWVEHDGYFINKKTLQIQINRNNNDDSKDDSNDDCITVAELRNDDAALYDKLVSTWSERDYKDYYHNNEKPPDAKFFDTFGYFDDYSTRHHVDGLRILQARARQQNVQYIETQLTMVRYRYRGRSSSSFSNKQNNDDPEDAALKALDATLWQCQADRDDVAVQAALEDICNNTIDLDPEFEATVVGFMDQLYQDHTSVFGNDNEDDEYVITGHEDDDADDCFLLRYQLYAVRTLPPSLVCCALYAAFAVASRCRHDLVRGVNIVGPENHYVALRDYWLHMQMFRYFRNKFPSAHVAMHAGELSMSMVVPEHLTHHVNDAVNVAGAERIGHGVDIVYETDSISLLTRMKKEPKIAVEICLSSNDDILGIAAGPQHPVSLYLQHGVPIVICTDDSGVARNSLESQYTILAAAYNSTISYAEIKTMVRNSIRYSFLCNNDKSKLLDVLERRFATFESQIAEMTRYL